MTLPSGTGRFAPRTFLRNLFTAGLKWNDDVDRTRKMVLINTFFMTVFLFTAVYGIYTYRQGNAIVALFDLLFGSGSLVTYLYLRRTHNIRTAGTVMLLLVAVFFLYLLFSGGPRNTGFIWSFIFPLAALFLLGPVRGLLVVSGYMSLVVIAVFLPGFPLVAATYDTPLMPRFLGALTATVILAFVMELARAKTQDAFETKHRELRATVAELERTQRKLEESNRELTDFAHIASHDLKEPLRKVVTFGDRLRDKAGNLDDRGRDYLDRMQNAAGRMTGLLDGLLEYARVTTKGRPFVETDMARVAREVLEDLEVRVQETGAAVALDDLPVIQADPLQMRQLLQNLIGNALKYHRPGVAPEIRVAGRRADGQTVITVEDNGIGIAPGDREKAFGVFRRLVGKNEFEGTGVGLAICKKIVERHGGTITPEGRNGAGTVFVILMPVLRPNGIDPDKPAGWRDTCR